MGVPASLLGDQVEQDRADLGRREGGDELAIDRPVGLADPLGRDPVAGDEVALGRVLAERVDGERPARLLVAGQRVGPEQAVADQRLEGLRDLPVQLLAALGGGGRLLQDLEFRVVQVPRLAQVLGEVLDPGALATASTRSIEPLGEVAERGGVVDHRGGDLAGLDLPLGVGLDQVAPLELGDVDADLAAGTLAEPVGERRPGAVQDGGDRQHGDADDGQPRQPVALADGASVLEGDRVGGAKLGPGRFRATFTEAHGRRLGHARSTGLAPSLAEVRRAHTGTASARSRPRSPPTRSGRHRGRAVAPPHSRAVGPASGGPSDPAVAGSGPGPRAGSLAS